MDLYRDTAQLRLRDTVVAIGVFDGVHRGHQAVIGEAASLAHAPRHNFAAVAFTFDKHPSRVLAPDHAPSTISTLDQRIEYIRQFGGGIDTVIAQNFTQDFASQSPDYFVEHILLTHLGVRHVFIGSDFRYGSRRAGSAETLIDEGRRYGFGVTVVPPVLIDGERVSSTRIRETIEAGRLADALVWLGHPFEVAGTVVAGKRLGRGLGYPTANLKPTDELQLLPGDGVYAGWAKVPTGGRYPAAISVGTNPTTDADAGRKVEAYLMDGFNGDLYDKPIELDFRARLRGQITFDGLDALKQQIAADVAQAQQVLKEENDS